MSQTSLYIYHIFIDHVIYRFAQKVVTVDIRHHRVLPMRVPEQMTEDQREVTKFITKINSWVEITGFTQFDERYTKQGKMIKFLEE